MMSYIHYEMHDTLLKTRGGELGGGKGEGVHHWSLWDE